MSMNQSYGDEFKKVCEGLCKIIDSGIFPFIMGGLIGAGFFGIIASSSGFRNGKEKGRQELLQEFNKTGWYYDDRAKEFWMKESTCK